MPEGYWWECSDCDYWDKDPSIVKVIRSLLEDGWDQRHLMRPCRKEGCQGTMRNAFFKKRGSTEVLILQHCIGIAFENGFTPMMWEWTYKKPGKNGEKRPPYFDFKYLNVRNPNPKTLRNLVSLTRSELCCLFELYSEKTSTDHFPW